jgi:Transposase IS66 family
VVCRLPRLVVQRLLEGALQIPMSLGSTPHAWEEANAAVAAPCDELQQALPQQPVLNGDETGHRTNGQKRWVWALVAPTVIVYTIATSRTARSPTSKPWSDVRTSRALLVGAVGVAAATVRR